MIFSTNLRCPTSPSPALFLGEGAAEGAAKQRGGSDEGINYVGRAAASGFNRSKTISSQAFISR
jgi:hypothetical protein